MLFLRRAAAKPEDTYWGVNREHEFFQSADAQLSLMRVHRERSWTRPSQLHVPGRFIRESGRRSARCSAPCCPITRSGIATAIGGVSWEFLPATFLKRMPRASKHNSYKAGQSNRIKPPDFAGLLSVHSYIIKIIYMPLEAICQN